MLPLMIFNNYQITKCKKQKTPTSKASKAKFSKFEGKYCNLTVSKLNQRLDQNLVVVNGNKVIISCNIKYKKTIEPYLFL